MADVFVSYSRRDKARVAPLVAAIEARGWSVWWDPEILPGQEFDRQIDAELKIAAAVLVVWTAHSVDSRWVRGEARDAADRDILVPVRFDNAILPIDVRAFHTIELDDAAVSAGGPQLNELLQALEGQIARHAGRPPESVKSVPLPSVPGVASTRVAICVLPFGNLSADPGQQYLSDGITEDIITELSRWRFLAVRSRSASFRYRGDAVDVKLVARELNVRFIVEGGIRRMGERIRITAQLIDTETGDHIWAEKFDRESADIFNVQDEVVRTIVSTLVGRVQVSHAERARKNPANLAAYEYVLKGNALSWDDPGGAEEAKKLFEKAIELDSGYGMAHALLASIRSGQWRDGPDDSDALLAEAYVLARRAVELDENDSTCFSIMAQVCLLRRSFDMALQHMQRAIEINPNNQWNNADMGIILIYLGQPEEALAWFKRAKEIDPYFDQPWYWRSIGQALMSLHRDEEALAMFEHLSASHYRSAAFSACCHARLGNMDQARTSASTCVAMKPDFSMRHFMSKEPYKKTADAEHLAESLLLAGLPT
ncbi:TIR domain-containing protein [Rhodanobacter sp. C03]|uniref:TIR domain-containing protein n=1 Tax=Rhodanobacter sp. C03 TaxID=1945858 RepID=UPI0011155AB1|nr:TIR domain-containing protein [Rhodanobacter sp. C03]